MPWGLGARHPRAIRTRLFRGRWTDTTADALLHPSHSAFETRLQHSGATRLAFAGTAGTETVQVVSLVYLKLPLSPQGASRPALSLFRDSSRVVQPSGGRNGRYTTALCHGTNPFTRYHRPRCCASNNSAGAETPTPTMPAMASRTPATTTAPEILRRNAVVTTP